MAREQPDVGPFLKAIGAVMGLGDRIHSAGTSVVAAEARAGSNAASVYSIAAHTVLWCDPALEHTLVPLADPSTTRSLADVSAALCARGWTEQGGGVMLLRGDAAMVDDIAGITVRAFRHDDRHDREMMEAFIESLPDEDRDEADLADGVPDEHVLIAIDADGVVAFASERPFDFAPDYGDIAVATRPDARGRGLGRLAVDRLCTEIVERGMQPLYRHGTSNLGSGRLSASLGFRRVLELRACAPS